MKKLIRNLRRIADACRTQRNLPAFANVAIGTHPGRITRTLEAAVAERHLLAKQGASVNGVTVAGASDRPIGTLTDSGVMGDSVNLNILGTSAQTQLMVASAAIAAGSAVYTAANGRIRTEPATAGTYYEVGTALTAASTTGELVEVAAIAPRKLVIVSAFTGTAATDIAKIGTALQGTPDKVRVLAS